MYRWQFVALLSLLTIATGVAAQVPPPGDAPALYEMVVTAPGSRSQGVRGQLFDDKGQPQPDRSALQPFQTPIGALERVGCTHLWSVCGDLRQTDGFAPDGPANDPTIAGPTLFRVSRIETAQAPTYRGELFAGTRPVPLADRVETPMGPFVRLEGKFAGQVWTGWIPQYWLPPQPERLTYQVVIHGLGSKSESRHGAFYDEQGYVVHPRGSDPIDTPIGRFQPVECGMPWEDCGLFNVTETFFVPAPDGAGPVVTVTAFRVLQTGSGQDARYRGELRDGDKVVDPAGDRVMTNLGPMVRIEGSHLGHGWTGWIPHAWLGAPDR